MKKLKKKVKINRTGQNSYVKFWQDEINFLENINQLLVNLRCNNDTSREELSKCINALYNQTWSEARTEWLQKGLVLGALRGGEAMLNVNVASLIELYECFKRRINVLRHSTKIVEMRVNRRSRKRRKHDRS